MKDPTLIFILVGTAAFLGTFAALAIWLLIDVHRMNRPPEVDDQPPPGERK